MRALTGRGRVTSAAPLACAQKRSREDTARDSVCSPGSCSLQEPSRWSLDPGLPASGTIRNSLLLQLPVCGFCGGSPHCLRQAPSESWHPPHPQHAGRASGAHCPTFASADPLCSSPATGQVLTPLPRSSLKPSPLLSFHSPQGAKPSRGLSSEARAHLPSKPRLKNRKILEPLHRAGGAGL